MIDIGVTWKLEKGRPSLPSEWCMSLRVRILKDINLVQSAHESVALKDHWNR